MTIPVVILQGATNHIKDGLPVAVVSSLGALTPEAEANIMQIKATADEALAKANSK